MIEGDLDSDWTPFPEPNNMLVFLREDPDPEILIGAMSEYKDEYSDLTIMEVYVKVVMINQAVSRVIEVSEIRHLTETRQFKP